MYPPHVVYLGLGGNQGNPTEMFITVIEHLVCHPHIELIDVSSIWRTSPVGFIGQPDFLNAVVACSTSLSLSDLYGFTSSLEKLLGKNKTVVNGPRTVDIDILCSTACSSSAPDLQVPHPRMFDRLFVLLPLCELMHNRSLQKLEIWTKEGSIKVDISAKIEILKRQSDQIAEVSNSKDTLWWKRERVARDKNKAY